MLAATVVMVLGIATVAVLSQRHDYRLGGVMVVPLVAIYTLREPLSSVVFAAAALAAWTALWALREYTLTHGRRVFLVAVGVGAVASAVAAVALAELSAYRFTYYEAEVVGSIFPGVAAYNVLRLDPGRRRADIAAAVAAYVALVAVGALAVYVLAPLEPPLPPVLMLPTSDVVAWVDVTPIGDPTSRLVPAGVTLALLVADVAVYEFVRKRYDLRLAGVILVPLLAVFSVRYGGAVVAYAIGAIAVFLVVSLLHWTTLLYGRNLLAAALVAGLLYTTVLAVLIPVAAPGITLFFVGLFTGISAYNLHRVAPKNRAATIRVSAGLFVLFYVPLLAVVDVPESAFVASPGPVAVALGAVLVALLARDVWRLERSIPDADAFARESVFGQLSGEDAATSSPLVAGGDEDD